MAWQLKIIFAVLVLLNAFVDVRGDDCTTSDDCNGGTCEGSPTVCTCPDDKYGTTCQNNQVCTSSGSECLNGGTCNEDSEEHICTCTGIYSGSTCQDKCDSAADCGTGGTCGGTPKVCTCPETKYGDRCTNNQVCTSSGSECLNGGTCNEEGDAHVCDCTGIYSGSTCQDKCDSAADCGTGGTCGGTPKVCTCSETKYGDRCTSNQVCTSSGSQCLNGGSCNDGSDPHMCDCIGIYSGSTCQDKCDSAADCGTGGTCGGTPKVCTCPETKYGDRCTSTQVCTTNAECLNGGTCNTEADAHMCTCGAFNGDTCQHACDTNADCNGGTCTSGDPKTCNCTGGKGGDQCEKDPKCTDGGNECKNEGTCMTDMTPYSCNCTMGYTGDTCEKASAAAVKIGLFVPFAMSLLISLRYM